MVVSKQQAQSWAKEALQKLIQKMPYAIEKAQEVSFIPYTVKDGHWASGPMDGICWWTNGFWPGEMLQMYALTNDPIYLTEARRSETMLDAAFADFEHLHHDVGFMWRISSGFDYALTKDKNNRSRALFAANLLAGRYNVNGFIRAWNADCTGWAIIDCMMNLSLLYWASEETSDPRFRLIATQHADTVLKHFIRIDGSSEHIVCFDPQTGAVQDKLAGQGYAKGSKWSRGQAWALYGFIISYAHTGDKRYLKASQDVADDFIANVQEDWLPDSDFCAPKAPPIKDDCAASIAACGLLRLADALEDSTVYFNAAFKLLEAMYTHHADWSYHSPAIFTHCTGAYHNQSDRHIAMNYCDYYFIEAVSYLLGERRLEW